MRELSVKSHKELSAKYKNLYDSQYGSYKEHVRHYGRLTEVQEHEIPGVMCIAPTFALVQYGWGHMPSCWDDWENTSLFRIMCKTVSVRLRAGIENRRSNITQINQKQKGWWFPVRGFKDVTNAHLLDKHMSWLNRYVMTNQLQTNQKDCNTCKTRGFCVVKNKLDSYCYRNYWADGSLVDYPLGANHPNDTVPITAKSLVKGQPADWVYEGDEFVNATKHKLGTQVDISRVVYVWTTCMRYLWQSCKHTTYLPIKFYFPEDAVLNYQSALIKRIQAYTKSIPTYRPNFQDGYGNPTDDLAHWMTESLEETLEFLLLWSAEYGCAADMRYIATQLNPIEPKVSQWMSERNIVPLSVDSVQQKPAKTNKEQAQSTGYTVKPETVSLIPFEEDETYTTQLSVVYCYALQKIRTTSCKLEDIAAYYKVDATILREKADKLKLSYKLAERKDTKETTEETTEVKIDMQVDSTEPMKYADCVKWTKGIESMSSAQCLDVALKLRGEGFSAEEVEVLCKGYVRKHDIVVEAKRRGIKGKKRKHNSSKSTINAAVQYFVAERKQGHKISQQEVWLQYNVGKWMFQKALYEYKQSK